MHVINIVRHIIRRIDWARDCSLVPPRLCGTLREVQFPFPFHLIQLTHHTPYHERTLYSRSLPNGWLQTHIFINNDDSTSLDPVLDCRPFAHSRPNIHHDIRCTYKGVG